MNILFWNAGITKNKVANIESITSCMCEMLIENSVDLMILAEYPYDPLNLCQTMNSIAHIQYKPIPNLSGCNRIRGIINNKYNIEIIREQSHYQIAKIKTSFYELIVAMFHGRSKRNSSAETQAIGISDFYNDIVSEEQKFGCAHTIAIGDFNVSPFEKACIGGSSMHAIPFPDAVEGKPSRRILGKEYRKFYNPTWKLFGNYKAPYTTYYFDNSGEDVNFYWYAIDQVLTRPSLIKAFDEKSLKIIYQTKNHSMMKNGIPDKVNYSDHLPLFCTLKEDLL